MAKQRSGQGNARKRRGRAARLQRRREKMSKRDPFAHRRRQQLEEERKDYNRPPIDELRGVQKGQKMAGGEGDSFFSGGGGGRLPRSFRTFLLARELGRQHQVKMQQKQQEQQERQKLQKKQKEEEEYSADEDDEFFEDLLSDSEHHEDGGGDDGGGDDGQQVEEWDSKKEEGEGGGREQSTQKEQRRGPHRGSFYDHYPLENEPLPNRSRYDDEQEQHVSLKKLRSRMFWKEKLEQKKVKQLEKKINAQIARLTAKSNKLINQTLAGTDPMDSDGDSVAPVREGAKKRRSRGKGKDEVSDYEDSGDEMMDRKAFKEDVQAEFALRGFGRDEVEFGEQVERPPDQRVLKALQKGAIARMERRKIQAKIDRNHKIRARMKQIQKQTGDDDDDDEEEEEEEDDYDEDSDNDFAHNDDDDEYESFDEDGDDDDDDDDDTRANEMLMKFVQKKKLEQQRESVMRQYRLMKKKQGQEDTSAQQKWKTFAHRSRMADTHTDMDEFN